MADKTLVIWWRFGKEHGESEGFPTKNPLLSKSAVVFGPKNSLLTSSPKS